MSAIRVYYHKKWPKNSASSASFLQDDPSLRDDSARLRLKVQEVRHLAVKPLLQVLEFGTNPVPNLSTCGHQQQGHTDGENYEVHKLLRGHFWLHGNLLLLHYITQNIKKSSTKKAYK